MKATIQKATLSRINEIWKKHKPQGLGFSDTDMIIIKLKTKDNKTFDQDFYFRLKGDGTIGHSITRASEKRQNNLQNFIQKYISKQKRYNLRKDINHWIGKEVELEDLDGHYTVKF